MHWIVYQEEREEVFGYVFLKGFFNNYPVILGRPSPRWSVGARAVSPRRSTLEAWKLSSRSDINEQNLAYKSRHVIIEQTLIPILYKFFKRGKHRRINKYTCRLFIPKCKFWPKLITFLMSYHSLLTNFLSVVLLFKFFQFLFFNGHGGNATIPIYLHFSRLSKKTIEYLQLMTTWHRQNFRSWWILNSARGAVQSNVFLCNMLNCAVRCTSIYTSEKYL